MSEEVNRKLPAKNATGTTFNYIYADPQRYNAQRYRRIYGQTDIQADGQTTL